VSTIAKGNAAEAAVVHALEKVGIVTLLPFGGGCPFDVAALLPDGGSGRPPAHLGQPPARAGAQQPALRIRFAADYTFDRWLESL